MYNSVDKVYNMIDKIRNDIFDYNLNEVFTSVNSLIVSIADETNLEQIQKDKIGVFNTILENITLSMQNKDYLLLSDVLKFQLENFLENM